MDHTSFSAHGVCYLWRSDLILMHGFGDLIIAVAYFSIPLLMWLAVRTKPALWHVSVVWWFIAFIVACGLTHVMDVITIYQPVYYVQGAIKLLTAGISIGALWAVYLLTIDAQYLLRTMEMPALEAFLSRKGKP